MKNFDKYLNTDYRIVVQFDEPKNTRKEKRHLVGRRGLQEVLGMELYIKFVNRAYRQNLPKITMRLRRGLTIIFYQK